MSLEDKINFVCDILKDKKVAIGFSGGADSTLLTYLSSKFADDTLAITIDNHLLPKGFVEHTKMIAETFGIRHEIVDINFYGNKDFINNDSKRCYNCRNLMYSKIEEIAQKNGFDFICDGNNISDLVTDRPGILITYEKNFNTPFIEAKLTSKEIHKFLNDNGFPYSRSTTCLATRIATDMKLTHEKIERIRYCEDYISQTTDCEIIKVRDLDEVGIIEVDNINKLLSKDKFISINDELKSKGFKKVTLNLSQIDDNEYIDIDYSEGSFSYKLPFTINLENTKNQLEESCISNHEKLEVKNIEIYENGLVEGHDLESHEIALNRFMEILTKLRRDI